MKKRVTYIKYHKKEKKLFFKFLFLLILNATSATYAQQTPCPNDFDCDGIIDQHDIDDDNDGIYDHIESPSCFELDKITYEIGDRREQLAVSTTLPYTAGTVEQLVNGINNVGGIKIPASTNITKQEIFRLTTKLAVGIEYAGLILSSSYNYMFTQNAKMVLQGSQDGTNWIDLTTTIKPGLVPTVTFKIDTNKQGLYKHYRLWGITGTTYPITQNFRNITGIVGDYMPSLYPKASCQGEDIDEDGMPNHQDLDADGDTCNDVIEVGYLDGDKDGKLGNSPVTVNQYGEVTSAAGYIIPINMDWLDPTKNNCTPIKEHVIVNPMNINSTIKSRKIKQNN